MPLVWKRGQNPYRFNYFTLLGLGAGAQAGEIQASRENLAMQITHGEAHVVAGQTVTEAEVTEAESRLLNERTWAEELLLVHPQLPAAVDNGLQAAIDAVRALAMVPTGERDLPLTRPAALAALLPSLGPSDVPLPEWDEFDVPGPNDPRDRRLDVQFDL